MNISYNEFKKVEIRAGKILSAEKVPDTDKLLKLSVDFGEKVENIQPADVGEIFKATNDSNAGTEISEATNDSTAPVEAKQFKSAPRQIVSGIALRYPEPAVLVGKTCMFVTNLEPRTIKGLESNGMLFAVSTPEGGFSLLEPNESIPAGTLAA